MEVFAPSRSERTQAHDGWRDEQGDRQVQDSQDNPEVQEDLLEFSGAGAPEILRNTYS